MSAPQQGSIEGPPKQPSNQEGASPDVNGSIRSANSAAESFLSAVGEIEVQLEAENIQLQSQIAGYELAVSALSNQVNSLKEELANQPDCDEDDGYAKSETPEQMAGEAVPPQMNENGGPS